MTMAQGPLALFQRHIHRLIGASPDSPVTDDQLLDRFVGRGEEEAFAALLARHGSMVLGVCRRVLGHEQEAEDAFQATFLLLARKAGSIRRRDSLAAWLGRVAYHVAVTARARVAKRQTRERQASEQARAAEKSDPADPELRLMLDEEMNRLPRKYHAPLVLCYLEGKTHEEAARELGWPTGTVKGRLARARQMLRRRLIRRGLFSAALAGTPFIAEAAVPTALRESTVQAARTGLASKAATGVSAEILILAEGASQAMFVTRLKIVAVVVLAVGLLATAASLVTRQVLAAARVPTGTELAGEDPKKDPVKNELEKMEGTWTLVSREWRGNLDRTLKKTANEDLKKWQLTIKGDQWTVTYPGGEDRGKIQIDPTKDPKTIDLTFEFPGGRQILTRGIYKLVSTTDGDNLTHCRVDQRGLARPKEFKVPESGGLLFVWKRASK
jgi:RNA polymerase sigma-70 factor (ECF subfamily)